MAAPTAGFKIGLPGPGLTPEENLALGTHWAVMPASPIELPLDQLDHLSPDVPVRRLFEKCREIAGTPYNSIEHAAVTLAEELRTIAAYGSSPDELRRWTAVAARLALREASGGTTVASGAHILLQSVFWDMMGSARIGLKGWQSHQADWHSVVATTAMFLRSDRPMELSPGINDGEYYCATERDPSGEESYQVHFDRLGMTALTTGAARALTRHEIAHALLTGEAVRELQKLMPALQPPQLGAMINAYEDIRVNVLFPEPGLPDLYRGILAALKVRKPGPDPENDLWGLSLVRAMKLPLAFSVPPEVEAIWDQNKAVILSLADQRTLPIQDDGSGITLNSYRGRLEACSRAAAQAHHHILQIFPKPPPPPGGGGGGRGLPVPLIGGKTKPDLLPHKIDQEARKICADLRLEKGQIVLFRGARETALAELVAAHRRLLAHGIKRYERMLKDELTRVREPVPAVEGEELSVPQFLVKRRIDPRENRLWINPPLRREASKFTIDLVCDVSGSVYDNRFRIIRPAVQMLALTALALEEARHRTSFSLFSSLAEILYHGSDPLARKRAVLSHAIESTKMLRKVERSNLGGGTSALYCLGAVAKNLATDPAPSPGPRIGLIFTDGNLSGHRDPDTAKLKRDLSIHIPLICVCFPHAFPTAIELFGKSNVIGVPALDLRAVDAIRDCIVDNVERLGLMRTPEENLRVTREINQIKNARQVRKLEASLWQK